jgi:hypothetical protein
MNNFPPITKQIYNFAKAVAKHAVDGWRNVDEATYNHRTSICEQCSHLTQARCEMCGCFISEKALWASEDCPKHKW